MKISRKTGIIIALNLAAAAAVCVWAVLALKNLPKASFDIEDWKMDHVVYRDHAFHAADEIKNSGVPADIMWGPYKELKAGSYTALIEYDADADQECLADAYRWESRKVISSPGILSAFQHSVSYPFELSGDVENFELRIGYNGYGDFSVRSLSIVPNNSRIKRTASEVIAAMLLTDCMIIFAGLTAERKKTVLMLAGIGVLASLPLGIRGIYSGHDLEVHFLRIEAVAQALRSGQFPARVSSLLLYGRGYPFSIFYNDIFLYFPAALRLLGFSLTSAYKIFLFFMNQIGVLICYFSFGRILKNKRNTILLTLIYTTASYRLTNTYVRAAAGEITAQVFLPLFGLAVHRIFFTEPESFRDMLRDSLLLAAAMSGAIASHIPTPAMICFMLLLICIFCWRKTLRKHTLVTLAMAAGISVLLNLYFLVPFVDYYFTMPFSIRSDAGAGLLRMQNRGAYPAQLFAVFQGVGGMPELPVGERLQVSPGLPLILVLLAGICAWPGRTKNRRWFSFTMVFSCLTLLLSASVFPWDILADRFRFWRMLTQLVQFPWRFLEFSILFLTMAAGEILDDSSYAPFRNGLAVTAVIMVFWFTGSLFENCPVINTYDVSGVNLNHVGSQGQYLLQGSDMYADSTEIRGDNTEEAVILSRLSDRMTVYCKAGSSNGAHTVMIPLYNYRGYRVTDEAQNSYEIRNTDRNLISIDLPDGFDGILTIAFRSPWYWTTALVFSAIASALCIYGFAVSCQKRDCLTGSAGRLRIIFKEKEG